VAVNPDSDSVSIVDAVSLTVLAEVPIGDDPRTLAITPDSAYAVVANHGGATLSAVDLQERKEAATWEVGFMPYGVVTDGRRAYVAESAAGRVTVLDLATGQTVGHIEVEPFPMGLALAAGQPQLLVTHMFTGRVSVIDVPALEVRAVVPTGPDSNMSQSVTISPDGSTAYLPQTRSNAENPALLFDTTVFPVVNVVRLSTLELVPSERITIDTADRPVDLPFAVAVTPDLATLLVAHAGSDNVSVIDLVTRRARANVGVGANPRGLALSVDGTRAFVNNVLDGTLSVFRLDDPATVSTVKLTSIPLAPAILTGKRVFNSAREPDLATDNWISCAVCHFDGGHDARTWLGFPDGPRNTPSLFGVAETGPFHWSGDLDELQDVELTIRNIQAGAGLVKGDAHDTLGPPHAGLSDELDALAAYLATLQPLRSPHQPSPQVTARGAAVFERLRCSSCHAAPLFTARALHDVGTGNPAVERNAHGRGTSFDTPSLRGLWATAPYFHDGAAATLEDVLRSGSAHNVYDLLSDAEREDLIAYLMTQ
jgi:YVTN family beta-propeller protein